MDIKEKFDLDQTCQAEVFIKDANLPDFLEKYEQLRQLMQKLRSHLPDNFKYYLVDFIVQNCVPGQNTCRDIRWHFDGDYNKENKYVLWVKGPNRTEFAPKIKLNPPESREPQIKYLEKVLLDIEPISVPDSTIVSYDSKTPHRGVKCVESGKRTFIRMMASNYIFPKRMKQC